MELVFDIKEILCYNVESTPLEELNKSPLKKRRPLQEKSKNPVSKKKVVKIEGNLSFMELSDALNKGIKELLQEAEQEADEIEEPKAEVKYIVQRVFNDTTVTTDVMTCDTEEEALKFIEKMKKNYPNLLTTSNLIVHKRKIN